MHAPALSLSLSFVVVIVQLRAFPPFLKAGAGRIRITTAVQKKVCLSMYHRREKRKKKERRCVVLAFFFSAVMILELRGDRNIIVPRSAGS